MHVEDEVLEELAAGERAAEERDRALADKDQQLIRTVQDLARAGHTSSEISEITGLSASAITGILTPSNRVCSPMASYSSKKSQKRTDANDTVSLAKLITALFPFLRENA